MFIDFRRDVDYSHAYWLWSDEAFARTSEAREWASSAFHGPDDVSEPGKKFGSPVLHLSAHVRHGEVRGIRLRLFDPILEHAQMRATLGWVSKQIEDRGRKSIDDARGVQLR